MHVLPERTQRATTTALAAALAMSIAIAYVDARPGRQSETTPPTGGDALSAEVTLRQVHLDADGRPVAGSPPALSFRLDRRRGRAGREMTMRLTGVERAVVRGVGGTRALDHPFIPVRMDHDATNGLRLYNARGERLRNPDATDRRLFGSLSDKFLPAPPDDGAAREPIAFAWVDDVLAAPGRHLDRRAELERAHGPSQGSIRGFDRFVSTDGTNLDEVLVDPATALPVETSTVRDGALVARAWMSYDAHPSGFLVRRLLRSERVVPSANRRRVVVEIELSNVVLSPGGDK
jgi:hypothetical protein